MASSWCNDTAGFYTLVVDEEGGSEGRQCSTEGFYLWRCWTKGQLLFGDSFHSFVVPKTERSSSQKNGGNHTKDSLGMGWHSMISAWCVEGWLVPALVKENLTKKLHWLKSRADISTSTTTPEDESFLYMQCYHRSLPTWATACWYRKGISKFNAFYMKPASFTIVSDN